MTTSSKAPVGESTETVMHDSQSTTNSSHVFLFTYNIILKLFITSTSVLYDGDHANNSKNVWNIFVSVTPTPSISTSSDICSHKSSDRLSRTPYLTSVMRKTCRKSRSSDPFAHWAVTRWLSFMWDFVVPA